VIARKWRPQTFEEVTGQELITQTLRNALEFDRLHHAYLFSGSRGVGKTTTARILAKALNCHKTERPNLTPCRLTDAGACSSCIEISESRSMDVLEIDAASHTGIDDVRGSIIDNINFNPSRDRFKVFIIDEVHQLSKAAFNALLKTLEEPPANVVFVMATTELHKVPETILSRCQEFEFRTIPLQKIFERLKLIAEAEKVDISDDALRELARSGEGSMRDAQSNFDQVISFSGDTITSAEVTSALGFAGVEVLSKTLSALRERDASAMLSVVDDLIARGHDLRNFCRDVLGLFRDVLVFKVAGEDNRLFDGAVFGRDDLREMAAAFTEADLLRFFNSLCLTESSLREAVHPRYVLEIGLVKLIEMRKVSSIESILERLDALGSGSRPLVEPDPTTTTVSMPPNHSQEKKTLISEVPKALADVQENNKPTDESLAETTTDAINAIRPHEIKEAAAVRSDQPKYSERIADQFVQRLPRLSAEELEHIDDARLDDAFDEKLSLDGDDLLPLHSIDAIIQGFLGVSRDEPQIPARAIGAPAAAAKPVSEIPSKAKHHNIKLPELSENPTEAELLEYARSHPAVRSVMTVFRAKITEVKLTSR